MQRNQYRKSSFHFRGGLSVIGTFNLNPISRDGLKKKVGEKKGNATDPLPPGFFSIYPYSEHPVVNLMPLCFLEENAPVGGGHSFYQSGKK